MKWLENDNVRLRAVQQSDLELIHAWENDTELWHLSNNIAPFSVDTIQAYLKLAKEDIYTTKQLRLMIVEQASHQTVGAIDLFDCCFLNQRAGVGILVYDHQHRRKELAKNSLALLKEYAFTRLHFKQLHASILTQNYASIKLFESQGFTQSGLLRSWVRYGNEWLDEAIYQCVNTL